MRTKPDETLEEIWAIRRRVAEQFGGNPQKRVAYYQRKQKQLGAKIYRPGVSAPEPQTAAALHDRAQAEIAAGQCATLTSYRAASKRKAKRAK
jgi:hypothetical protein